MCVFGGGSPDPAPPLPPAPPPPLPPTPTAPPPDPIIKDVNPQVKRAKDASSTRNGKKKTVRTGKKKSNWKKKTHNRQERSARPAG